MSDPKPFKTFDEQIEILKKRGLIIADEEFARNVLSQYGYYEVINGYKTICMNQDNRFEAGTTFEHLFSLFRMDKAIRQVVAECLKELESFLQTTLSYTVSEYYGADEQLYLVRRNFLTGKKYKKTAERDKFLHMCEKIIGDDTQPFQHYHMEHGNVPPWILVKGMTFGNLILFYRLQKSDVKNKIIARLFGVEESSITEETKEMTIRFLYFCKDYRNRAAHDRRIYNFRPYRNFLPYLATFHSKCNVSKERYDKDPNARSGIGMLINVLSEFDTKFSLAQNAVNNIGGIIDNHISNYPIDRASIIEESGVVFTKR